MRRTTLTQKLTAAGLAILVLIAGLAGLTVFNINQIHESSDHVSDYIVVQTRLNGLFNTNLARARNVVVTYTRTRNERDLNDATQALQAAQQNQQDLTALDASEQAHEFEERGHVDHTAFQRRRENLLVSVEQNIDLIRQAIQDGNRRDIQSALDALRNLENEATTLSSDVDGFLRADSAEANLTVHAAINQSFGSTAFEILLLAGVMIGGLVVVQRKLVKPLKHLAKLSDAVAAGELGQRVEVTTNDEVGALQQAFNEMIENLQGQRTALEERANALERSAEAQRQLFATIQELSTPILPVLEGVVVLPIIGHVDSRRADDLMQVLLRGVAERRAKVAILDITGIAAVDTHVIKLLLQAVQATELLGARVFLAGISATVAQVIVEQGISLGRLRTFKDLRGAVEAALELSLAKTSRRG